MFTENWFDAVSQTALIMLYAQAQPLDGAIVEIGCWEGRSTCALAQVCEPETVIAVDTWQGSPDEPCWEIAKERDVFATFQTNVAELTSGNVEPHRMGWREFLPGWDKPIKFAHIDAQHTYEEVRDNILALMPLMVSGGVMCGHDAPWPPVWKAATETLENVSRAADLWWTVAP